MPSLIKCIRSKVYSGHNLKVQWIADKGINYDFTVLYTQITFLSSANEVALNLHVNFCRSREQQHNYLGQKSGACEISQKELEK